MNLELRQKIVEEIHRLEGLLIYALKHGEDQEVERIRLRLAEIIENL